VVQRDFLFVIIALQKIVKTLCIDRIAVNDISFFCKRFENFTGLKIKKQNDRTLISSGF